MDILVHTPASIPCPECGILIKIHDNHLDDYFNGVKTLCLRCLTEIDWWTTFLNGIKHKMFPMRTFMLIGAEWTIVKTTMRPGEINHLDFTSIIPEDARILYLNYTPHTGGLFPLEIHSNTPDRHIIPSSVALYPMPLGDGPHGETLVHIVVIWVKHSSDDEAWQNLTNAFDAYVSNRYESSIIPANVTVELTMNRILTGFLEKVASRKYVEPFLQDGATYGYQLNVLLPALLSFTNAPKLPDHIRGLLNGLKKLRNDLAHRGKLDSPLETDKMAEYLCAALFAFHYLRLIQPILRDRPISLARSVYDYALKDYRAAGDSYGPTDEGLLKWLDETRTTAPPYNTELVTEAADDSSDEMIAQTADKREGVPEQQPTAEPTDKVPDLEETE